MKSKTTAYLLWFFLGLLGVHKFYLEKFGMGIIYFFTFGVFGIGWFIDLFTLGSQVDTYNLRYAQLNGLGNANNNNVNKNVNNIVINTPAPATTVTQNSPSTSEQLTKLYELKEKGILSEEEFATEKAKILSNK